MKNRKENKTSVYVTAAEILFLLGMVTIGAKVMAKTSNGSETNGRSPLSGEYSPRYCCGGTGEPPCTPTPEMKTPKPEPSKTPKPEPSVTPEPSNTPKVEDTPTVVIPTVEDTPTVVVSKTVEATGTVQATATHTQDKDKGEEATLPSSGGRP